MGSIKNSIPVEDQFYLQDEMSYRIEKSTNYFQPNKEYYLTLGEIDLNLKKDDRVKYSLNNYGHRSDDFKTLEGHNILFAGCSQTFGIGLPDNFRWSKILHNRLKKDSEAFYCLSFPGAGFDKIVHNILKFCNEFGNPNSIFICFADYTRQIVFDKEENKLIGKIFIDYKTGNIKQDCLPEDLMFKAQMAYRVLEIYCFQNNINLVSTSWSGETSKRMSYIFPKTFKSFSKNDKINKHLEDIVMQKNDKEYKDLLFFARDGHHSGILENYHMSDFLFNSYLTSIGDLGILNT
jgi:hypothetical protein